MIDGSEYLVFEEVPNLRETRIVSVRSKSSGDLLGSIRYRGAWRQYVFHPEPQCIFNGGCLADIIAALKDMNDHQREKIRARRAKQ